ncbi:MAG: CHAT domain-containing protein [Potamolinea sp.]
MSLKLINIDQVAVAQEFHISVTPLGKKDEYLVRIERVAPGVPLAEEQVCWPMEDWLAQARQLMNDPLLGVLQGNAAFAEDIFSLPEWNEPVSPSSLNLVTLGEQLYDSLFQGSLRDSWMMAQAIAQNQRQVLRLRLGLKGSRLPRIPWEVLHGGDRPLATGTDVAFSRYQLTTGRISQPPTLPSPQNQPLKILMVIAGPSDQESLELAQEAVHLREELKNRSTNGSPAIELEILQQPGREKLAQKLEQGRYQVFHYAGHSNLGDSGGDVYLVSDKTGLTETLNGTDLAGLLVNNGIQLAVFNSCRGVYTAASDVPENGKEGNLAEALVRRGIPAVLAMAERIPDEVALTLTRLLYRNLNQGYPIDLSLSRARQGLIAAYGSNQLYWALPVLYLHPEFDGFLTKLDDASLLRSQLFILPEPLESSYFNQEQGRFTPQTRGTASNFLDMEDELDNSSLADYEDDALNGFVDELDLDPGAEDTSAFIKNLLSQINTEPKSSEAVGPASNFENHSPTIADAGDSKRPAFPPNSQSPSPQKSAPIPAVSITPSLLSQNTNNVKQRASNAVGQQAGVNSWRQKLRRVPPQMWLGLWATGIVAISGLGFWLFQNRAPSSDELLSNTESSVPATPQSASSAVNGNLKTIDTSKLTETAREQLSQGNIATGQKAVEELLNREALPQAKAALSAVPKAKLDEPAVSFLRGRLAWQFVKKGNKDFALSDAQGFWYTAHKAEPKAVRYLNALGFAYYAQGKFDKANEAWLEVLKLSEPTQGKAKVAGDTAKKEALNTYAGLAMGLWQTAQKQPANQRGKLLNKALGLRQQVMTTDPVNFQPDALSKDWLWSEKAIQDWRNLLVVKN